MTPPLASSLADDLRALSPLAQVVADACRAPSVHNTQPWRWRLDGTRLDLFADRSRHLRHADPDARDLLISCGAALHHAQTAAAGHGWRAQVRRLPDRTDHDHVATITLTPGRPSQEAVDRLDVLRRRTTDRRTPTSWPVPSSRLIALASIGSIWGAQVLPVDSETVRSQLQRLTTRADRIQRRDRAYVEELTTWTGRPPSRGDGIPEQHLLREREDPSGGVVLDRHFPAGTMADTAPDPEPRSEGMLIVCTSSDDTISRIRAGEALSAVWLHAAADNLGVVPLSQAVEVDGTREELQAAVLGDLAFPQILLRVGWLPLERTPLQPTDRRPLDEVLEVH